MANSTAVRSAIHVRDNIADAENRMTDADIAIDSLGRSALALRHSEGGDEHLEALEAIAAALLNQVIDRTWNQEHLLKFEVELALLEATDD
jgi:hypothetical protein